MNLLKFSAADFGTRVGFPYLAFSALPQKRAARRGVLLATGALAFAGTYLGGQDADPPQEAGSSLVSIPLELDISRRSLRNFLTDDEALVPYRSSDGNIRELAGVFTIGSASGPYAAFWDSRSCRLLGVIDIKAPEETASALPAPDKEGESPHAPHSSPYVMKASGPALFAGPAGGTAKPVYFGFRLVEGRPEFLYTHGSLEVEERIWLEEGGKTLKQRFSVRNATKGFRLMLPPDWKKRVVVSSGSWKNGTLTVPAEAAGELILSYRIADPEPEPADSN